MNKIKKLRCLNCQGKIKNYLGIYAECKKCKSLFKIEWNDANCVEPEVVTKKMIEGAKLFWNEWQREGLSREMKDRWEFDDTFVGEGVVNE